MAEKNLYITGSSGRIQDLSVLIKNINKIIARRVDPEERTLLLRITQKAKPFKDDANNKTHSLYHLSSKKELDEANPQEVLDLIMEELTKF